MEKKKKTRVIEVELSGTALLVTDFKGGSDDYLDLDFEFSDGEEVFSKFKVSTEPGTLKEWDTGFTAPLSDLDQKKIKIAELILDVIAEENSLSD